MRQIAFYLEHQQYIDEWAKLRALARATTNEFLLALVLGISELANELGSEIDLLEETVDAAYPLLTLYKHRWKPATATRPLASIGLSWTRNAVNFVGDNTAYVGVRVEDATSDGRELQSQLRSALRDLGGASYKTGAWWPVYRYEGASGEYWKDLAAYRELLVDAVRTA